MAVPNGNETSRDVSGACGNVEYRFRRRIAAKLQRLGDQAAFPTPMLAERYDRVQEIILSGDISKVFNHREEWSPSINLDDDLNQELTYSAIQKFLNSRSSIQHRGELMEKGQVTEDAIFECFAAAEENVEPLKSADSFVDVEEYENDVMYPSFAKWADAAGYPEIARLFMKVAGEEKLHSKWLRELYQEIGAPKEGKDTARAKDALSAINANMERLVANNPEGMIEKALKVAIRVENREWSQIYPSFRDQALATGNRSAANVYQKVIDSEKQHASWFEEALAGFQASKHSAVAAPA